MKGSNSDEASAPIMCDMTDASDTPAERMAEYAQLFQSSLAGRERTAEGIRFRFRADDGVEARVRDLAAREHACCAFLTFSVTRVENEVLWDASVVDDEAARAILDEFYLLPDTATTDVQELHDRFAEAGLPVMIRDASVLRVATPTELFLRP
ncbi:MAG TPA: hypothetical protein VIO13_00055 [Candidatus Dormibacteraeota bacterium]|jgi:hypothetical protein